MIKITIPFVFAGLIAYAFAPAQAAEISGAVGVTSQGDMTYRGGLGWQWDKQWFNSSAGHLGGYWDLGYTYWEGGEEASGRHSLSFSPVFEYEFGRGRYRPFIDFGIGIAFFSGADVGDQKLGSSFNFEDRFGFGVKLGDSQRVGVRMIHYSNAGISQPNDGIESYSLYYAREI
ncbi:Lipid A deacylase PagL precursor [compost metagenome]